MSELVVGSPLPPDSADMRVGDAERRAVDEWLHRAVGEGQLSLLEYEDRTAAVWSARTRGELASVTRDLPSPHAATAPLQTDASPVRAVGVLSRDKVAGPVGAGQPVHAYALLGSAKVDLRRGDLPPETHVRAVSVLGEVKVLVPEGACVQLSGYAVMGQRTVRTAPPRAGAPIIYVEAVAVMGEVHVRSAGAVHPAVAVLTAHRRGTAAVQADGGSPAGRRQHQFALRRRVAGVALLAAVGMTAFVAEDLARLATVIQSRVSSP